MLADIFGSALLAGRQYNGVWWNLANTGTWPSQEGLLAWDQEVSGSNPLVPTSTGMDNLTILLLLCIIKMKGEKENEIIW